MNFFGSNQDTCGCNQCPTYTPTYQQYNQVVQTCNVEEVPHYINYHTHVVNNLVKKHVNIPTYSTSGENVVINDYAQIPQFVSPWQYQQPYYGCQMGMPSTEYLGNVGTNPYQQPMGMPYTTQQYPNTNMPGRY